MPYQELKPPQQLIPRRWGTATMMAKFFIGSLFCLSVADAASDSVIWESGDQIVQLVKQDDKSAPANDHPISTTAGDVAAMLEGLRLHYSDEGSDVTAVSVFTKEEIDNLGKAVATGLGRAEPSQDIIFHVIGVRRLSPGAFARRNRVSAGRIFYRGGNLNIIFGQVQTPYRKKNVYGRIDEDFYPRNYGSRTAAAKHDVVLLATGANRLYQSGAGVRDDWIIIEPGAAAALPDKNPDLEAVPIPAASAAPVERAETSSMPSPPAARSSDPGSEQREEASTHQATPSTTADVEQRLDALKRLRERELISEDAYQAKMKEILQDL